MSKKEQVLLEELDSEKPKNLKKAVHYFFELLMLQKKKTIPAILSNIIGTLAYVSIPLVTAQAIDGLIEAVKLPGTSMMESIRAAITGPLLILLIIAGIIFICNYFQEYLIASVSEEASLTLRKKITAKLNKLPLNFYDQTQVGDLLSRTTADADKVANFIIMSFNQFISSIIIVIVGLSLMIYVSGRLSLIIICMILVNIIVTKVISKKNQTLFGDNMYTLGKLSGATEEYYSGNTIIKAFNKQEEVIQKADQLIDEQYKAHKKAQFVNFAIYPIMRSITQLAYISSALMGATLAIQGTITIGLLQAFLQYVNQISDPITEASYVVNMLQGCLAAIERIYEVLDEENEVPDIKKANVIDNPLGQIEFSHVSFGYNKNQLIMKDVNFIAEPKKTIAIVGPTGAGKTTLVNLLMRFYEINSGSILFDGIDTNTLTRHDLRKQFGMVLQDTWLFEGTIAENISYGKKDATREEVIAAAKKAQCDSFIQTLPEGYDTIISSENNMISQGQQQLLTIARTILSDPKVMILDEATSSIDTKTEIKIQQAIDHLMLDRTSFVIAHRLSTIKNADLILVMDKGNIIETGSHHELLEKDGFYADLYQSQFQSA
ncbi:ABC transporter ATP-binding protein [Carnobacterium inhibens]|uniref:ATP-binding cassette domain-containing protein n=1 Tax=Carnobacterium inhibens TaxID=147709 RepID=A0ABR7TDW6_9LACT|nr:ABC transporter ATP-binding protein [Carnobacterium inhibens]MBC9825668.1 ATP-binding cassette domain-containing protein [Carnobacterium inhibens]